MNAPFSEGEIIRQSQQGNAVRLDYAGIPGILFDFFICPVEGTSIQWQLLPWAFDQELRMVLRRDQMMGCSGDLEEGRGCNEQSLVALVGSVHAAGGSQPLPASPPRGTDRGSSQH